MSWNVQPVASDNVRLLLNNIARNIANNDHITIGLTVPREGNLKADEIPQFMALFGKTGLNYRWLDERHEVIMIAKHSLVWPE